MWPGFGENSRVIEWIFGRCSGDQDAVETPIGYLPAPGALDLTGLAIDPATISALLAFDPAVWVAEADAIEEHYAKFGSKLPAELAARLSDLKGRVGEN
jgi:phosphoenolpyruvate carboxykinase (GTP)